MKKILIALCSLTVISLQAAAQQKFSKDPRGFEYKIVKSVSSKKITLGDVVFMDIAYSNSKDSMLFDSKTRLGQPAQLLIGTSTFKGDLNDALQLIGTGDSAVFKIKADSIFERTFAQPRPAFVAAGSYLNFYIKVVKAVNQDELLREQQAEADKKAQEEEGKLEKYIADNKLTVKKTQSGLRYYITQNGTGATPSTKSKVSVHYTGKLLNGQKFDSSVDRGEPFSFTLGVGQVIKGWDEGIALLNKGSKAVLLIPSYLGYGSRGAGGSIGPFEPLQFEVELIDFQ